MAMEINQIRDAELSRQKRNSTDSQKKKADLTKEGVVINSFVKDPKNLNMDELYDSMIISENVKLPEKINENKNSKEKNITPIILVSTGVMALMALTSIFVKKNAQINLNIDNTKRLLAMPRNLSINEETHQAIYQMVQCPNQKTILAGVGVFAISAMAFMGKMFLDGFKEVWVKKKEANIQKNLQENLIAVETQSFSGKIQIIRSMLSDKAKEFSEFLCTNSKTPAVFSSFKSRLNFTGKEEANNQKERNGLKYFALGALTIASIVGLGFVALKNLTKGKKYLEKYIKDVKTEVSEIIKNTTSANKDADKLKLKSYLQSIDADDDYIKSELNNLNWDETEKTNFIKEVIFDIKKSTMKADKALGGDGPPKTTFYSHVNDYRAFLYNYLLDTENKQFKQLFFGITGVTALSYGGSVLGEAVKEVQVKKMNAQTELELQQRLVATELRNFKAKKDAAINPLCDEFYVQLAKDKPKEELKTIAENILFEVKNGPPFVYS